MDITQFHSFFINFPIDGYNSCGHTFLVLVDKFLGVKLLTQRIGVYLLFLKKLRDFFPKWLCRLTFLPATSIPTLIVSVFLTLTECVVESLCGSSFVFM